MAVMEMFVMSIAAQLFVPVNTNAICIQWQITRPFYSVHFTVTEITKVPLLAIFPYFLFDSLIMLYIYHRYIGSSCAFHRWVMSDESNPWESQAQMSCSAHLGPCGPTCVPDLQGSVCRMFHSWFLTALLGLSAGVNLLQLQMMEFGVGPIDFLLFSIISEMHLTFSYFTLMVFILVDKRLDHITI